jgi:hypothetical protein
VRKQSLHLLLLAICLAGLNTAWVKADDSATTAAKLQEIEQKLQELEKLKAELEQLRDAMASSEEAGATMQADIDKLKKIKISGYIQPRFTDRQGAGSSSTGSTGNGNFAIRRGRLKVASETDRGLYTMMLEASEAAVSLKEGYVDLKRLPTDGWTMTFGKMNMPFGFEIERSSSTLELVERSQAENRYFTGETFRGLLFTWQSPDASNLFRAGLYNGNVWNTSSTTSQSDGTSPDADNHKDICLNYRHIADNWAFGVSDYIGEAQLTNGSFSARGDRKRVGADFQWYYDGGSVFLEYYKSKDASLSSTGVLSKIDGNGWYGQWNHNLNKDWTFTYRYNFLEPDKASTTGSGEKTKWHDIAFNWYLDANTRLTFDYTIKKEDVQSVSNNEFVFQALFKF